MISRARRIAGLPERFENLVILKAHGSMAPFLKYERRSQLESTNSRLLSFLPFHNLNIRCLKIECQC